MKYPAPCMTVTELSEYTGIPKSLWYQAAHHYLSYKYIVSKKGARTLRFDTAAFEKVRTAVWK